MMGANFSSPAGASVSISSHGLEDCSSKEHNRKPIKLINNNSTTMGIQTAKVLPSNGLKSELINMNSNDHHDVMYEKDNDHRGEIYERDNDSLIGEKTKFEWDNQVPLMDPRVVDMMVEKMEMMRKMKKMMSGGGGGGGPPMMNGQVMPNGTMDLVDGKMPSNGNLHLNGMTPFNRRVPENGRHLNGMTTPINAPYMNGGMPENGRHLNGMTTPSNAPHVNGGMPENGRHLNGMTTPSNAPNMNGGMPENGRHLNGMTTPSNAPNMNGMMPPNFPKLMGSTENAVRIVRHMKTVFNSAEIQDLCDEKMDSSDGNLMFKMMQCKLEMEFKFLNDLGMGHLSQLIATGKLPPVMQLIFICYQDEPEVIKELAFIGPVFSKRPDLVVKKGDAVPNIILRTCSEEAVSLSDLHINKNLPLVVFAASSS